MSDAAEGELSTMSLQELDKLADMIVRAKAMLVERDPITKEIDQKQKRERIAELQAALGRPDPTTRGPANQ